MKNKRNETIVEMLTKSAEKRIAEKRKSEITDSKIMEDCSKEEDVAIESEKPGKDIERMPNLSAHVPLKITLTAYGDAHVLSPLVTFFIYFCVTSFFTFI